MQEADREGPAAPLSIDAIVITDASIIIDGPIEAVGVNVPRRIDHLDARLSFQYEPVRYSVQIASFSFQATDPALRLNELSGGVAVRDDEIYLDKVALKTAETSLSMSGAIQQYLSAPRFNVELSSDKVSLSELARVVPALEGIALQPAFELKLDGPLDELGVTMNVQSTAGRANGRFLADIVSPGQSVLGEMTIEQFNLAAILPTQPRTDLTATVKADLHGAALSDVNQLVGNVSIHSSRLQGAGYTVDQLDMDAAIDKRALTVNARARAYGIGGTLAGRVLLPENSEPIDYDLHGDLRNIDLGRLPRRLALPTASTDIGLSYSVRGREPMSGTDRAPLTSAERTRRRSLSADLTFEESSIAGARIAGGSLVSATMKEGDLGYRADATIAGLDLQRVGNDFGLAVLATDRFLSDINGHIAAEGRGTSLNGLNLRASGELDRSTVLGGQISPFTFTASVADDAAHLIARGDFSGFDPAPIAGNEALKGQVAGTVDINATVAGLSGGVTLDAVAGDVTLVLQPSKAGDLAIDRAVIDGSYRDRRAEIRQLEIAGLDLSIEARGALALDDSGASNLSFKADSPQARATRWAGRPLAPGHCQTGRNPYRKPLQASCGWNAGRQWCQVRQQWCVVADHHFFGAGPRTRSAAGDFHR